KERFEIYCTPCHGQIGDGQGMIAKRGFTLRRPVGNYHTERLRKMPVGHFYDVITNGYGSMYSYASRIEPRDRWAVVAYVRALQLSQGASTADKAEADAKFPVPPAPKEERAAPIVEGGGH
ncbi:MAG: cytochrome c, partial [Chlorobia bacterium]|nr:cytochrome c [Fimbriimonadaceae bacterium]